MELPIVWLGMDEVNYSPSICGDTIVCALQFLSEPPKGLFKDSKLTHRNYRLRAFQWLQTNSLYVVEVSSVNHIGLFGVNRSRSLAMYRAAMGLIGLANLHTRKLQKYTLQIDGPEIKDLSALWELCPADNTELQFIVDGDAKVPVISAASIIAKLYSDSLFEGWEKYWPGFGMNKDHGSPSPKHVAQLRGWGLSPIHRATSYPEWWKQLLGEETGLE